MGWGIGNQEMKEDEVLEDESVGGDRKMRVWGR